ncbi:MAG: hypothetical protein JOY80_02675, partial [Candidatus Dormibacteraeota bacterium]|nr:hypothetical protein [Candidatus Dormibacteraeota bacterium]
MKFSRRAVMVLAAAGGGVVPVLFNAVPGAAAPAAWTAYMPNGDSNPVYPID